MWIFRLLTGLPSLPSFHIWILGRSPCPDSMWRDFDKNNRVCYVRQATVLDRSDEHIGEGSWGVCNPQEGFRMACTGGMSWVHFLQYNSEVGWLDTRPQKRANIIYQRCPSVHFCVSGSNFSRGSSDISRLFHLPPNAPSLVKTSAHGFQTPSPSLMAGLLNGQRLSLLQSTTRILCGVFPCP